MPFFGIFRSHCKNLSTANRALQYKHCWSYHLHLDYADIIHGVGWTQLPHHYALLSLHWENCFFYLVFSDRFCLPLTLTFVILATWWALLICTHWTKLFCLNRAMAFFGMSTGFTVWWTGLISNWQICKDFLVLSKSRIWLKDCESGKIFINSLDFSW